MKTKCKPVPSQTAANPSRISLKSWRCEEFSLAHTFSLRRCPALCLTVHLHKTAPWDPCTTGLLMPLQHYPSHKNYFSANTTGSLPWEDLLCLLISSLRCQSSLYISFKVIPALDLSHISTLFSAGFALNSPSFYVDRGNPESICSLPLPHKGKFLVTANCSEFFGIKTSSYSCACLIPTIPSTKAKHLETWTAVEPILQLINTSTSSPKICLIRHSLPIQAATAA